MTVDNPKKPYKTTTEGMQDLQKRLDALHARRRQLAHELHELVTQNGTSEVMYDHAQVVSHEQVNEIEHQINALQRLIANAVVVTPASGVVSIGSRVTLLINGKKRTFTIVGFMEADPLNGQISDESPFGKALVGKKIGDSLDLPLHLAEKQSATIVQIDS